MPTKFPSQAAFGAALGFVDFPVDRLSGRRDEKAFIDELRAAPQARTLVLAGDTMVLDRNGSAWHSLSRVEAVGNPEFSVFLGKSSDDVPYFAAALPPAATDAFAVRDDIRASDLRSLATQGLVPNTELGALATAKALIHWHRSHRFCSNCAHASDVAGAGWRRECPNCKTQHFPRTDPVVIMLAIDGERCLLGRQARFVPGMYSCLAGFLEPGESIEDAVRREIAEEAGIETGYVSYLGSQPWPFPASIMIGCHAEATSTTITIDRDELEDARWFSRDECRSLLDGTHPDGLKSPPPMAIAHHILSAWVFGEE